VKLSRELSRRGTGRTLYILDEPTTGLHFEDTRKLLDVLNKLVDQGNTVVVIEHNLDVIKSADHVIDLGGGPRGGVASSPPRRISASASSARISGARDPRHGRAPHGHPVRDRARRDGASRSRRSSTCWRRSRASASTTCMSS
jgi:energy-coupling factor transporter ATP-binding protein EcfA2